MKKSNTSKDVIIGLILFLVSFTLFCLEISVLKSSDDTFTTAFFIHYFIALFYFGYLYSIHRKKAFRFFSSALLNQHLALLLLFNVSAFSLNRTLTVFTESTDWLTILLVVENVIILSFMLMRNQPKWLINMNSLILSVVVCFHLYQFCMTLPLIGIGILATPFLGISLLILVPFFFIIALVKILTTTPATQTKQISVILGIMFAVASCTYVSIRWHKIDQEIESHLLSIDAPIGSKALPDWVRISQKLTESSIVELYLMDDMVYQSFAFYDDSFGLRSNSFEDYKYHDPLITIASALHPKKLLDETTRLKILNFLYDKRHESGDRFWSGADLSTSQIVTNIELHPNSRLSYSELIISIKNNQSTDTPRWRNQQEAFYTFQLPDGGIVTSLSLWIEGQENTGILTTKEKAKTAYNTIVGREMRDPSVVYWMEGNKIRVRVFPCTPQEDRKFKLGITAPLTESNDKLYYEPISFKGPKTSNTNEAIYIVDSNIELNSTNRSFEKLGNLYHYKGNYSTNWSFSLDCPLYKEQQFTFENQTYSTKQLTPDEIVIQSPKVFLDISNNWELEEIQQIAALYPGNTYYFTYQGSQQKVTSLLNPSNFNSFTLFPFYEVADPSNSIIITKGSSVTPNLKDLEGSEFTRKLNHYFTTNIEPPVVLDIANSPSDYMRSLKEFNIINYNKVTLEELKSYANSAIYPSSVLPKTQVRIPNTDLIIAKSINTENTENGSDHLMRLFAYQQIMKSIGKNYFQEDKSAFIEDDHISLASLANVVTPVSSLIVLETQQDYDRFGIKRNTDSLGNAQINNSGEAPEPHEWAFIIIGAIFLIYLLKKRSLKPWISR